MNRVAEQPVTVLPETPGMIRRNIPIFIATGLATIAFSEAAPSTSINSAYAQECTTEDIEAGNPCETVGDTPPEEPQEPSEDEPDQEEDEEENPDEMSRRELARGILVLVREGRIVQQPLKYGKHEKDKKANATPIQNLKSVARGRRADTSDRCSNAPSRGVHVSKKILQFMYELGNETRFSVTTIAGGCHMNGSEHYEGDGFDMGCSVPVTRRKLNKARRIGRPLNIKHNHENCANDAHYHFSIGGR